MTSSNGESVVVLLSMVVKNASFVELVTLSSALVATAALSSCFVTLVALSLGFVALVAVFSDASTSVIDQLLLYVPCESVNVPS